MKAELNDLVVFVHVVQAGSFTAAAKRLRVPKSSVSRRVAQLEADLDTRLLQRTTRRLSLTDLGRVFYDRASRLVADAEEAERSLLDAKAEPSGRLRVTAPIEYAGSFGVAARFLERYPKVELDVVFTSRVVDLVGEAFDLAIRAGTLDDSSLVARKLFESRVLLVASPAYLARAGAPSRLEDLAEHDCIVFGSRGEGASWSFRTASGKERSIPLRARATLNHFAGVRALALEGAGIARIPDTVCGEDIAAGRLVALLIDHCPPSGAIHLVYPSARHLSANVRAFIDFLMSEAERGVLVPVE